MDLYSHKTNPTPAVDPLALIRSLWVVEVVAAVLVEVNNKDRRT